MTEGTLTLVVNDLIRKKMRTLGMRAGRLSKLTGSAFETDREFAYKSTRFSMPRIENVERMQGGIPKKVAVITSFMHVDRQFVVRVNTMVSWGAEKPLMKQSRDVLYIGVKGSDLVFQYVASLPEVENSLFEGLTWKHYTVSLESPGSLDEFSTLLDNVFAGWFTVKKE